MQIPFVAIGSTEDRSIIQIDNDHRSACRELTEKLLTQGIRKIALIGGNQSYMVTKNRLGGFMEAYTRQGLELEKEHIYLDVEDGAMVKELVQRMIKEGIECIITMDDYLCSCVLNTLQQLQIHVPEQVKVASFYDSSFLENHVPSITSIQFDVEELGRMTCKTLLGMIEGEAVPEKSLLGYEISLRNSTEKTVLVQNR